MAESVTASAPTLSVVVPLWNEARNIEALVDMLAQCALARGRRLTEAVLVDNGSTDGSAQLLTNLTARHPWLQVVRLAENQNYGGGIYEGCRHATGEFIGFIPGDLQYSGEDLSKVFERLVAVRSRLGSDRLLVKGNRVVRLDPGSTRFVSSVYTRIARNVLKVSVQDINGLPKIFHRSLLSCIPATRMRTFVFDAQLIALATANGWHVEEVDVTFHARREGVSSWSGKRFRTYATAFRQLFEVRRTLSDPGVPLTPAATRAPNGQPEGGNHAGN